MLIGDFIFEVAHSRGKAAVGRQHVRWPAIPRTSLVELSPSHFAHVFKETTGMTPLQFITRQRITLAQQLIRETSRSLIDVGLEVGYTSPSHFAQVFRRVVGVTPTEFRSSL